MPAERVSADDWGVLSLGQVVKDRDEEVEKLRAQMARLTERNLQDREVAEKAVKELAGERAGRVEAETKVKDLSATVAQGRETAGKPEGRRGLMPAGNAYFFCQRCQARPARSTRNCTRRCFFTSVT